MTEARSPDAHHQQRRSHFVPLALVAALTLSVAGASYLAGSSSFSVSEKVVYHVNSTRHHVSKHLDGLSRATRAQWSQEFGKGGERDWPGAHVEILIDNFCRTAFPGIAGTVRGPEQPPVRIYDGFILGDYGKELVHARLNELGPFVDYFIIVEDNKTFTNKPKDDMAFGNHREEFADFEEQIIYVFLGDIPDLLGDNVWLNEHVTRQSIWRGLNLTGKEAEQGDWLIAGDVDEVARARALLFLRHCQGLPERIMLRPDWYKYGFEYGVRGTWGLGPHAMVYQGPHAQPQNLVQIRNDGQMPGFPKMEGAAWHCSWCFARVREMINKLESWGHQEMNLEQWKNPENIVRGILESKDMASQLGDDIRYDGLQRADAPAYVLQHPEDFQFLVNRTASETVGFEDFYEFFNTSVYDWPDVRRAAMSTDR